jgi:hypothetical protein
MERDESRHDMSPISNMSVVAHVSTITNNLSSYSISFM